MPFISGLSLCERFYREAVRPEMDARFPGLPHAAALIGSGSEALGFDDAMSTDHHWGPRVMLFLAEDAAPRYADAIDQALRHSLPYTFYGYSTHFTPPDPNDNGTQLLAAIDQGPVNHRVTIQTARQFFMAYLGFDIDDPLEPADWLTFSEQRLRSVTSGGIFHDDIGLRAVCDRFAYYPHDVWLYLLAAGWARIGQEEHLMGRAGLVGDETGSALIGGRLARDIMRLCFLMERAYVPYPKWFGTAFRQLRCAGRLEPALGRALRAETWQERERHLVEAYEIIAAMHNALELTAPLPERAVPFFGRPFRVMAIQGFSGALLARIADPVVKRIAARPPIGGIDLFSDSTDLLSNPQWRPVLRRLYE